MMNIDEFASQAKQHIVCYSGGHSSALVAIEVSRRYGTTGLVLLNHDINPRVEDADIKRFKQEVADYIGVPITYANMVGWDEKDQFDVSIAAKAFKTPAVPAVCTNRLKTEPFHKWLASNASPDSCVIYYGFDLSEQHRITRRVGEMAKGNWRTDYPLARWNRTITSTRDVGIEPPLTYGVFKHANCVGCLKAKTQHWYAVYCTRDDIFRKAIAAEEIIGHTILPDQSMKDIEPLFQKMKCAGIEPTEHIDARTWWAKVKKNIAQPGLDFSADNKPCECVF